MINLETAKLHLRVDHDDEDTLITSLIETAQAAVSDYLGLDSLVPRNNAPSPISAAMLLLVGDLYANREASGDIRAEFCGARGRNRTGTPCGGGF